MPKVGFNLSFVDGHIIFCEKLPLIFSRIEASKESKADFISTCVVLAVLMVTFLENYIPSL